MPIYEYRCKQCEKEFEKYVAAAGTAVACPSCASGGGMRKLSVFGLKTVGAGQSSAPMTSGGGCCGGGWARHRGGPPPPAPFVVAFAPGEFRQGCRARGVCR